MKGFVGDIEHLQLVLMCVRQGEEIGLETHYDRDQFFRIESGMGELWIDGRKAAIEADDAIIVPAGAEHNIVNTGEEPLHLYTLYAPPEHRDAVTHATKADAASDAEHFDGRTTEICS